MHVIVRSLNNQRVDATCRITERAADRHGDHVFAELPARTRAEAIASLLGPRPTR